MAEPGHTCGGCTVCCELVPVKEIEKRAFHVCAHQRDVLSMQGPACAIYAARPHSCRAWSCLWLKSPSLPQELKPSRSGIVIDEVIDLVRLNGVEQPCAQIWVTRGHEDDFKSVELVRDIIRTLLHRGLAVLWRLPPNADGALLAIGFRLVNGAVEYSNPVPADAEHNTLGDDSDRLERAAQLAGKLAL